MRSPSRDTISIILATAILTLSAAHRTARAEEPFQIPGSELSIPGVVRKSPISAPTINGSAYVDLSGAEALAMKFKDAIPHTRGAQDISLFRDDAPSVVLILVKDGLGSGSLILDNVIVTNLHVVDHNREVTVVFKPTDLSGKPTEDEIVKADVVKLDVQRDLALVRPRSLPKRAVRPLQISSTDIEIGSDVAAIGHPEGEAWTYTKGIVSQIRPDYEWSGGAGDFELCFARWSFAQLVEHPHSGLGPCTDPLDCSMKFRHSDDQDQTPFPISPKSV